MTNAMLIFEEEQRLAEEGKIAYTGKTFKMENAAGEEVEVKETEPIHTYQTWKALGYQVRKGQTAVTKLTIWKHTSKAVEKEDGTTEDRSRMFMKTAAFFALNQVDKIEA